MQFLSAWYLHFFSIPSIFTFARCEVEENIRLRSVDIFHGAIQTFKFPISIINFSLPLEGTAKCPQQGDHF